MEGREWKGELGERKEAREGGGIEEEGAEGKCSRISNTSA